MVWKKLTFKKYNGGFLFKVNNMAISKRQPVATSTKATASKKVATKASKKVATKASKKVATKASKKVATKAKKRVIATAKTAAELFGDARTPTIVSYARVSTKPSTAMVAADLFDADVVSDDPNIACLSYQQQHESNRRWFVQNYEQSHGGNNMVKFQEFGSAYQSGIVPPTLLGLLRHLRNATLIVAFADRFCRNIDNLRKVIAPLMRKNKIRIVVSGSNQMFELVAVGYETNLLKMTNTFVMYHEESAIKSERSKALHLFRVESGEYERRRAAKQMDHATDQQIIDFVKAAHSGTLVAVDVRNLLQKIAAPDCRKFASAVAFKNNNSVSTTRIAMMLSLCNIINPAMPNQPDWTADQVELLLK